MGQYILDNQNNFTERKTCFQHLEYERNVKFARKMTDLVSNGVFMDIVE